MIVAAVVALANLKNSQRRQRVEKRWHVTRREIAKNTVIYGVFFIEVIRAIVKVPPQRKNSQRQHLGACNSCADAP